MTNEEKILQMLGTLATDMASMKTDIDARFESMENRFESMENRQEKVETRLENLYDEMLQTRILVEKQDHNIRLIAEQYGDIAKKLDKVNEKTAQIEDLQDRVRALETVVISHTTMLKELKKAE